MTNSPDKKPKEILRERFQKSLDFLNKSVPRKFDANRQLQIAMMTVTEQPILLACTTASILRSVIQAAQLGLDMSTTMGQAYLLPFKNKGTLEAQLVVGYRGLITLVMRAGFVSTIESHIVYTADHFEFEKGTNAFLRHVPVLDGDRGDKRCVWALARMRDQNSTPNFDVIGKKDIEKRMWNSPSMKMTKGKGQSPWKSWPDEMWRKTGIRILSRYLPASPEISAAFELENRVDTEASYHEMLDFEIEEGDNKPLAALPEGSQDVPDSDPDETSEDEPEPAAASKGTAGLKAKLGK